MATYAMVLSNRVIEVLFNQGEVPYFPPDPSGFEVIAVPCDDTIERGMNYNPETGEFAEPYDDYEPEPLPDPQPTQLDRIEAAVNKSQQDIIDSYTLELMEGGII